MAWNWRWCPICRAALAPRDVRGDGMMFRACTNQQTEPKCPFIDWNNPIPVAAMIVPKRGRLLLIKRGEPPFVGEWALPSGHIDEYEDPIDAALRELIQETGIVGRVVALLNQCTPQPPKIEGQPVRKGNNMLNFYLVSPVAGYLEAGDDATEARYFSRDKMPRLCFPTHQWMADGFFAGKLGTLRYPRQVLDIAKLAPAA